LTCCCAIADQVSDKSHTRRKHIKLLDQIQWQEFSHSKVTNIAKEQMNLETTTSHSSSARESYPNAINLHFKNRYNEDIVEQLTPYDEYLSRHLFFITMHTRIRTPSDVINEFTILYFKTCKAALGRRLGDQIHRQPLAYAFADFQGTRFAPSVDRYSTLPHLHALALVRPEMADHFSSIISEQARKRTGITDIDIQNFDPGKRPVCGLIGYCMKGYLKAPPSVHSTDFLYEVFPRHNLRTKARQIPLNEGLVATLAIQSDLHERASKNRDWLNENY